MLTKKPLNFTKGVDRSVAPLLADKSSLYILRNLRHTFEQRGILEQTPYWYNSNAFSQGTYYNGGSQTEPSNSAVRLFTDDVAMTDYVMWRGASQLQVFYQTVYPAVENVNTGCRLVINDVTALNITLGSTVDVAINTDGTHFHWRKNGGAWSADIVISVSGNNIDGTNATVYWLASSGFTVGDTWSWTRTDASFAYAAGGSFAYPSSYSYYKGNLYFNSTDDRMMVCSKAGSSYYVISVGYRPVVGAYHTFFDDHLVLTWFNKATSGWTTSTRSNVIGWSDKTDIHNFIPTDTNEADQYTLPNNTQFDSANTSSPVSYLMGVVVIADTCFAFTNNEIYFTSSYGLPLVFSWKKQMNVKLSSAYDAVVKADFGVYIIGYNDIYFFNGAELKSIGAPVIQGTNNNNFENSFGCWDPFRKELVIALDTLLFCYQEKWDAWYVRLVDFTNNSRSVTCLSSFLGLLAVGTYSRKVHREDTTFTHQPVFDDSSGTTYAKPYLVTQILGDNLSNVKELRDAYLSAIVGTSGVSSTYYTTSTGVTIQFSYWLTPNGDFTGVSEVVPSQATWTSAQSSNGQISGYKTPFRGIALALEIQGTASKPPANVQIQQFVPIIYNEEEKPIHK